MRLSKELIISCALMACFIASSHSPAMALDKAAAEQMTKQASELDGKGKIDEAIELEKKAIAAAPAYWLPHSAMAYLDWRKGMLAQSFDEGLEATKLAPGNAFPLIQYAQLHQLMGSLEQAVPLYVKASKMAPDNWVPMIGRAQCLIMVARVPEATKILDEMLASKNTDFEWWYRLSDTYLKIKNFKSGEKAAEQALALAKSDADKKLALEQLFIASMKADDLNRAKELQSRVFAGKPTDEEVYNLVLSKLVADDAPSQGKALVDGAKSSGVYSGEFYYVVGKDFDERSQVKGLSAGVADEWVANAQAAFNIAVKYAPTEAKYHLALAQLMDRIGKRDDMVAELQKAQQLDEDEPLAPYLVSQVKTDTGAYKLGLTNAVISLDGVGCACKLPSLETKAKSLPGVVFCGSRRQSKPYKLIVLIDQSKTTVNELVHQLSTNNTVVFTVENKEPVVTVVEAIKVVKDVNDHNGVKMTYVFKQVSPTMPII